MRCDGLEAEVQDRAAALEEVRARIAGRFARAELPVREWINSGLGSDLLGVSHLVVTADDGVVGTVPGMSYASDLTDEQWALLQPVFSAPGKRGPKHAPDLRRVVDAMLYVFHTGCQWRFLPESFGPWTRVWSQFRRWSRNGTWARALTVLHTAAREADGRAVATPSMVVIDTHLARGASTAGSPSTTAAARTAAPKAPSAWWRST
jgi:transposase